MNGIHWGLELAPRKILEALRSYCRNLLKQLCEILKRNKNNCSIRVIDCPIRVIDCSIRISRSFLVSII